MVTSPTLPLGGGLGSLWLLMRAASKKPRAFAVAASLARRRPAVTVPRSLAIGVVPLRWQGPVMGSGFASGAAPATPVGGSGHPVISSRATMHRTNDLNHPAPHVSAQAHLLRSERPPQVAPDLSKSNLPMT